MEEYIEHLGRTIGIINREKQALIIRREKNKHYFRKYKGYGMSTAILDKIAEKGIANIILIEITTKGENVLKTTRSEFYEKGIKHKYKKADYQLILPRTQWRQ